MIVWSNVQDDHNPGLYEEKRNPCLPTVSARRQYLGAASITWEGWIT